MLVIFAASLAASNPVISADREDVLTLQPYAKYFEWLWSASMWLEFNLEPFRDVLAPFECGRCAGCLNATHTDCVGCATFLCPGIPNVGTYSATEDFEPQNISEPMPPLIVGRQFGKDGVAFREAVENLLGIEAQLRQTSLSLYIVDYAQDSPQVLLSGHLRVFLNETPLQEMQFNPPAYDTGLSIEYAGIRDLTSSTLRFLWLGSATIHVIVRVDYRIYFRSASSPDHLVVRQSCVIERRLLSYLGAGRPSMRDCEFVDYYIPSIQI